MDLPVTGPTRRTLFAAVGGTLALGALSGCSGRATTRASAPSSMAAAVAAAEASRSPAGRSVVHAGLTARATTLDLGGPVVETWAYGDAVPGPLIRATAGDLVQVRVDNDLDVATSVHWHGVALRNDMDGVPGTTQSPIGPGGSFTYSFTAPHPGTYFYHPHSGVQLDRGLYGRLIVDDPQEAGDYDEEWTVVLDDWVDGTGRTPDSVLAQLVADGGSGSTSDTGGTGMDGMDMAGMSEGMTSSLLGGAGDVTYPYYLANGRVPTAPVTFTARPGDTVRMRLVNAGSDTAFRVALGGHRLTVTHTDGWATEPVATDALVIGMGERFDVLVTLQDGVFPLVARAEGKTGQALALVRTGDGAADGAGRAGDARHRSRAGARHDPRRAGRRTHPHPRPGRQHESLRVDHQRQVLPRHRTAGRVGGERVRLTFVNRTMMFHPMHVHGHTFAVVGSGLRKDTVVVRPMTSVSVDLDADNPGLWMTHCHNVYHAERGMMTVMSYG